jgi:TonB family protein
MKKILALLILLNFPAFCQQIYPVNEVEKPAEPAGGVAFLNQFIASNMQIPIRLATKGMNARVFVQGVIEPDGSMSEMKVIKSVDSLSDKEALRILSLYKAWKPALIKEKAVRQTAVFPVSFRTNPMPEFDSTENAIVEYFDKNNLRTADVKKYKFRNFIPTDHLGYVRSDILYQELKSDKWKTLITIPFYKKEIYAHIFGSAGIDSVKAIKSFAKTDHYESSYEELIVQTDGKLLSHAVFPGSGKPPTNNKSYYLNGMLKEEQTAIDSIIQTIDWYDNGQLHSMLELGGGKGVLIKNVWERDGRQIVKDGNGWGKVKGNSWNRMAVYEEGKVLNGNKSGRWTGKLADSTLVYEEVYEDGKLIKGINKEKQVYTNDTMMPAQFKGGPEKLYRFLGENINYPSDASSARTTGRVIVSFTITEDGSLTDYKIEKSVLKSLDQEALRVIKKSSGLWEPATFRGQKTKVRYTLPINFDIN